MLATARGNDDSLSIGLIRRRLSTRDVGFELHLFTEVPSTNDVACRLPTYAHGTVLADAQVSTLRDRLLKVAVWIERSARRIVLHLPQYFPWLAPWRQLAAAVGAT